MEDHLGSSEIIWLKIYLSFFVRWLLLFQLLNKNNFPLFAILRLNCSISKIYIILSHYKGRIWISRHLCVHNTGQYSMHCSLCRCRVGSLNNLNFPPQNSTDQYCMWFLCKIWISRHWCVYRTVLTSNCMWFLCKTWISRHFCIQNSTVPVLNVVSLQNLNFPPLVSTEHNSTGIACGCFARFEFPTTFVYRTV